MRFMSMLFAALTMAMPVSAATIPAINGDLVVLDPAPDNTLNLVLGAGTLDGDADQILNFEFISSAVALQYDGGVFNYDLTVSTSTSDLAYVEAALFAIEPTENIFVSTTGFLDSSQFGSFAGPTIDFNTGSDFLLSVFFFNSAFGLVSNPADVNWTLNGAYSGKVVKVTPSPVPLPAAALLLLVGLGGLGVLRITKKA